MKTKIVDRTIVNRLDVNANNKAIITTQAKEDLLLSDEDSWQLIGAFHALDFKQLVLNVGDFTSEDTTRPVMTTIHWIANKEKQTVTLEAADAFHLMRKEIAMTVHEDSDMLLHANSLRKIVKAAEYPKNPDEVVYMFLAQRIVKQHTISHPAEYSHSSYGYGRSYLVKPEQEDEYELGPFPVDTIIVRSNLMTDYLFDPTEGIYPDTERLLDQNDPRKAHTNFLIVNADEFHADLVDLVSVFNELYGEKVDPIVGIEISENLLRLACIRNYNATPFESKGLRAYLFNPIKGVSGGTLREASNAFNMLYMTHVLQALPFTYLRISWARGTDMMVFQGSDDLEQLKGSWETIPSYAFVMPMHILEIYPNRSSKIYPDEDIRPVSVRPLAIAYNEAAAAWTEANSAWRCSRTWVKTAEGYKETDETPALLEAVEKAIVVFHNAALALVKEEVRLDEPCKKNYICDVDELKGFLERDPSTYLTQEQAWEKNEMSEWAEILRRAEYSRNLKPCRYYGYGGYEGD